MSESLGAVWQEFLRLEVRTNLLQRRSDAALAQQALVAPSRRRGGHEQTGRLRAVTAVPLEAAPPPVRPGRARAQRALLHSPRRARRDGGRPCRAAKDEAA
jgi:hypothetical protein